FDDRHLIVDNVAVAVENLVGPHPAARLAVKKLQVVDAFACGIVGRNEALAATEACNALRTSADDAVVEIKVVAALFQHEAARITLVATPIAHEESAVVGLDMLRGLDRNDLSKLACGLNGAKVLVEGRIAKDETNHQALM